ncbi:DMT family transporter [Flammeovirga sp. MY04]|uniref:DMT family transporter n=1 Tax=Flammeovirga sp. MY04 TaxID=1191459 RepID=UPI0008061D8A|nr:DMT family transporter [Flammeovirga sp. MY04]ANQ50373.1 DMT family transporter [Flammeovirga sp. MY04]
MAKSITKVQAHLFLVGASFAYGANYNVAKIVMPDYVQPKGFILMRVIFAAVLFTVIHRIFIKEKIESTQDYRRLVFAAFFGACLNMITFFEGLSLTSPINASVIMVSSPILVLIMSAIILNEKVTAKKVVGIVLGLAGALILVGMNGFDFSSGTAQGDILVIVNACSYGYYLILIKPLATKYHPFTILKWVFIFGAPMVLPFGIMDLVEAQWHTFTPEVIGAIAFVLIGATCITYLFNAISLQVLNASTTSFYIYFQPLIAGAIAVFLFGEQPRWEQLYATILIFTGVALVSNWKTKSN